MFADFSPIFEALEAVESELRKGADQQKRESLTEVLLRLRNAMDECIQEWLKFEERLNLLQHQYGISLPDSFPEGFLGDLENLDTLLDPDKEGEPEARYPRATNDGEHEVDNAEATADFFHLRSHYSIGSFRRGLGFWDLAMLEEAIREFRKVTELEPNFLFAHLCLGLAYSQKGDYDQAMKELRLVLALSQSEMIKALVYNTLGNIYAEQKKYNQALEEYHLALENDENLAEVYFNIGAVYFNQKDYCQALEPFEKALSLNPQDWEVYFYLGKAYEYLGEEERALKHMLKAYSLNPQEAKVCFELGIINQMMGKRHKAAIYFQKTKELSQRDNKV
ncbi:MAG: tetratricopeptide repeat protein [Dethiobacteria bacterium]